MQEEFIVQQRIYYNGDILTMESPKRAEAVLTGGGVIRAVGPLDQVKARADGPVELFDLKGRALMPSFIDAHSHLVSFAETLGLSQLSTADSFDAVAAALAEFRRLNPLPEGRWIMGFGYDHNLLAERRHPDRRLLDAAVPDRPALISNASGHMGVVNSAALEALGVTADTPDPDGGKIGRDPSGQPNGYLEESAFLGLLGRLPQTSAADMENNLSRAQDIYLSHGITTAQEGLVRRGSFSLLEDQARSGRLKLDVVGYADLAGSASLFPENERYHRYRGRLRLGGYKIFLDGSPQGRTAWLTKPYEGERDYRGYPSLSDDALDGLVARACDQGVQLLAHCNGDAAADQLLAALERADRRRPVAPLRPVMIHAQVLRPDQLDRMIPLGVVPSFFVAHTYYWGDVHRKNLGARANAISPARSAVLRELRVTLHQDTPVLPPDPLDAVWCAVNRVSRSGVSMGEAERLTPLDALRAVTLWAAYQYFEEDKKGSIRAGKRADLIVLNDDPLTCDPKDINRLQVEETILGGETVFRR